MIFPANRVRIIVATKPVDFRNYAESETPIGAAVGISTSIDST
ncbi:hypothetical protein Brsp05_01856 [Brucella sp. NBRC 12953]